MRTFLVCVITGWISLAAARPSLGAATIVQTWQQRWMSLIAVPDPEAPVGTHTRDKRSWDLGDYRDGITYEVEGPYGHASASAEQALDVNPTSLSGMMSGVSIVNRPVWAPESMAAGSEAGEATRFVVTEETPYRLELSNIDLEHRADDWSHAFVLVDLREGSDFLVSEAMSWQGLNRERHFQGVLRAGIEYELRLEVLTWAHNTHEPPPGTFARVEFLLAIPEPSGLAWALPTAFVLLSRRVRRSRAFFHRGWVWVHPTLYDSCVRGRTAQ